MNTRILIRTDGTVMNIGLQLSIGEVSNLIGATRLDTVALRHLGDPLHIMLLDDHGYDTEVIEHSSGHVELRPVRARKPINSVATGIYLRNCRPGTKHQIVGDVVVAPDAEFS